MRLLNFEQDILIALGSNLPGPHETSAEALRAALVALCGEGLALRRLSRFYANPAIPKGSGPDFVNAVAALAAPGKGSPGDVLAALHSVEARLGRTRSTRWAARVIDLDLIAVGETLLPDAAVQADWRALSADAQRAATPAELILPHPRMQDRAFVLGPLAEIAPGWRHPGTGARVEDMLAALPPEALRDVAPI
ncbi:2-amino-4-hydroxy-6-hydroxymethyldihydropteridinepyrophosphokinase [Roseivivax jejudonensis]|uniref:2-amino-4-hydroxy-6-hydroxymethyldihydropteridine pyrophosphokinase n=2 Tax=Roseivivax jejudonensis TaxID=1529041 RepID=A0A1X6YH87_9RHOB|nr:2-amino-4-hydroxy-6-hydroxymethyldihydropteridinepyrophosphokinase [Roseivivax jejudonensis]